MRDWIKENIVALFVSVVVIWLVAVAIIGVKHDDDALDRRCAAALRGATTSDSLRVIMANSQCRP